MSSEKLGKRLFFRWTAPKGFTAMLLFSTLAFFTEYLLVWLFLSLGLTDKSIIRETIQVPLTDLFFTITVSPLLHLVPLGVIVVLVASWTHLTKSLPVVPHRIGPIKGSLTKKKRRYPRALEMYLKPIRRFSRRISGKFRRANQVLKVLYRRVATEILRIRGVSYVLQQLFFARAAVKSTTTILTVFLVSNFLLYTLGYPRLIHDLAVRFYANNPSFLEFVLKTIEQIHGIGQTLSPIGWINDALVAAAPGFRSALEDFGATIVGPIAIFDLVWKYALCQNVAAWISAIVALTYDKYTRPYRRRS